MVKHEGQHEHGGAPPVVAPAVAAAAAPVFACTTNEADDFEFLSTYLLDDDNVKKRPSVGRKNSSTTADDEVDLSDAEGACNVGPFQPPSSTLYVSTSRKYNHTRTCNRHEQRGRGGRQEAAVGRRPQVQGPGGPEKVGP